MPLIPHIARKSHNFPGSNYVLPADETEGDRLQTQHEMLMKAFGNKLVLAPIDFDSSNLRFILDIGTGTGTWIMQLANRLSPSVALHGIDIQTALVPSVVPPNVSFSLNTVTRLPSEWTDKFDLVHQRLLVGALKQTEWPIAMGEIHRVLRPGGWVQLTEAGPRFENYTMTDSQKKVREMLRQTYISRDLLYDCAIHLPQLLEGAGFCDIAVETRLFPLGSWAGKAGIVHRKNIAGVHRGMKTAVLRNGGFGIVTSEDEFDRLIERVERDWDEIEGSEVAFTTIVARKPVI